MENLTSETKDDGDMPTLKSIELALKLAESKKEALKQAFLQLDSHPYSSFLPFSWPKIDAHFSVVCDSLQRRFSFLRQAKDPHSESLEIPRLPKDSPSSSKLCLLCKNMDGKGIREHIASRLNNSKVTGFELANAFRFAHDSSLLVLDAVEHCDKLIDKEKQICVLILEEFVKNKPDSISREIIDRAKSMALDWFNCLDFNRLSSPLLRSLANLIAAFALGKQLDQWILVTCFSSSTACNYNVSPKLLQMAELDSSTSCSLIDELLEKRKYYCAVRYVCALHLREKYHPEDIVKAYIDYVTNPRCFEGANSVSQRNSNMSADISSLQRVMKLIEEFEIGYPKKEVEKRIEMLKRQKGDGLLGQGSKKRKKSSGPADRGFSARPVVRRPFLPSFSDPYVQFQGIHGNTYGAIGGNYLPVHGFRPPFVNY